jgi:hypothetical protein
MMIIFCVNDFWSVGPAGRIFILFAASCRQAVREPMGVLIMFMLLS